MNDASGSRLDLAQALVVEILEAVDSGQSLDRVTQLRANDLSALGDHLRSVCREHCYGILRHRGRLRALVKPLIQADTQDFLKRLLEVAVYELVYTRIAPHATVDFAVKVAKDRVHPRVGGFVNAVLRNFLRRQEELQVQAAQTLEGCYSFPKWWIDRLQQDHPTSWRQILRAQNEAPPMTLRVNTRQISREAYGETLTNAGFEFSPVGAEGLVLKEGVAVESLPGFSEGWVSVQDASAQWAAHLIPLASGQLVLDACAAPGGKTAHLLEREDISVVALDADLNRLHRVEDTLRRLHLKADLRCANAEDLSKWWDGTFYDHILLDAPCSGSGVTRRHPDIRWLRRPEDLAQLGKTQGKLLRSLWRTLKPGGTLLYVTCSVFRGEGPEIIQAFLNQTPEASLETLPEEFSKDGFLLPDDFHDGFYYARLRKN